MAFRDSWHSALVYFGLAEERDGARTEYVDDEPVEREGEVDMEDRYRERPNGRRLSSRRRRDEFDDIFADDEPAGRPTTVLRPVGGPRASRRPNDERVPLLVPKAVNDAQQVLDKFKDSIPVILNLQGVDVDLS